MSNLFKNKKLTAMIALILALSIGIGASILALSGDIDIKQNIYTAQGVSIDLTQTNYPGDNSDEVKHMLALSEVPKNPVIKNTGKADIFAYMAVTIPFDTVALTSYDGTPAYATLTQLFSYGYDQTAGARDSWKLVEEGYFGDVKIVPVENVLQGATEKYGAYDAANKTVTYVWAYVGANGDVLDSLANRESTEALFDYIKLADIDGKTVVDGTKQIVVVSAYGIQADNVVGSGQYDPAQSTAEDVLTVWNVLNKLTPAANVDEDEHPDTDVIIRKLIDGPSFNAIIKTAAGTGAINEIHFGSYNVPRDAITYDVSNRQNGSIVAWCADGRVYVTAVDGSDVMANEDSSYMFSELSELTSVEFANFYTSTIVDASYMFQSCSALEYIDTSKFSTHNVLTMEGMFKDCVSMQTLTVSDLEMQNVTDISYMFYGCSSLNNIETEKWKLNSCINAAGMFQNCASLTNVELSGFAVNGITNMSYMFAGSGVASLDVSNLNTSKVMNFEGMFKNCVALTEIVGVGEMDVANGTNMSHMFQNCDGLEVLELSGWKTGNMQAADYMFEGCDRLAVLDIQKMDVSSLTSCDYMFANGGFTEIYGSDWTAVKTITAAKMFYNSPNLPDFSASTVNWSKAYPGGYFMLPPNTIVAGQKFGHCIPEDVTAVVFLKTAIPGINDKPATFAMLPDSPNYTKYTGSPLNYIITSDGLTLTDVSAAQNYSVLAWMDGTVCKIASVDGDVIRLNPDCYRMFYRERMQVVDFGVNGVVSTELTTNMGEMFYYCSYLKCVNMASFDTQHITNMDYMFCFERSGGTGVTSLTTIYVGDMWSVENVNPTDRVFHCCDRLIGQSGKEAGSGSEYKEMANYDTGYLTYYDGNPNTLVAGPNFQSLVRGQNPTEIHIGDYHTMIPEDQSLWINFSITADYSIVGWMDGTIMYISTRDGSEINTCGSMYLMFRSVSTVNLISFRDINTVNTTNMAAMFGTNGNTSIYSGCGASTIVGLEELDTQNVTRMDYMFAYCSKLQNVDISKLDTSSVTDMSYMFASCSSLTRLSLSGLDTSNVTNMSNMFRECRQLSALSLSGIDTAKVTDMSAMFYFCQLLAQLDLSSFDTSNVTAASSMFQTNSYNSMTVYVGDLWDMSSMGDKVVLSDYNNSNQPGAFGLTGQDGSQVSYACFTADKAHCGDGGYFTYYGGGSNALVSGPQFQALVPSAITKIYFGDYHTMIPTDRNSWIDFSITQDYSVLGWLEGTTLYVTSQDGNVINACGSMYEMFSNEYSDFKDVDTIVLKNIDTSKTINMAKMFYTCTKLVTLDVSCFNTTSVTNMSHMFYNLGVKSLNLSAFDTANVTNMDMMFYGGSLRAIYVSDLWTVQSISNPSSTIISSSTLVGQNGSTTGSAANAANYQTGRLTYFDGRENTLCAGPVFSILLPTTVTDVYFGDYHTIIPMNSITLIDFSAAQDGSVVGWVDGTVLYITTTDGSAVKTTGSLYKMFYPNSTSSKLTKVDFSGLDFSRATNMGYMFGSCATLTEVKWPANIDTSSAKDMSYMFYGCTKLPHIDVSDFDTSNVTTLARMFHSCTALTDVRCAQWDVGKVTDTSYMFYNCYNVVEIDLSGWLPSSLTTTNYMFYMGASAKLKTICAADWTEYGITSSSNMFGRSSSSNTYPLMGAIKFNGSNGGIEYATYITGYFTYKASSLNMLMAGGLFNETIPTTTTSVVFTNVVAPGFTYTDVSEAQDGSILAWLDGTTYYVASVDGGKIIAHPISGITFYQETKLTSVDFGNVDFSKVMTMTNMFYGCTSLTSIDVSMLDTGNVQSCAGMFQGCTKLGSVDLSSMDASKVSNISNMFYGCTSLTSASLPEMTDRLTSIAYAFYNCTKLANVNASALNTSNVTDMHYAFYYCSSLTELDLSGWKTSNVADMYGLFQNCNKLTRLDLSGWDTSKVTTMSAMFFNCALLKELNVNHFDVSSVTDISNMFNQTHAIEVLDLSSWQFGQTVTANNVFGASGSNKGVLKTIYAGDWTTHLSKANMMFNNCEMLVGGGKAYNSYDKSSAEASPDGYFSVKPTETANMLLPGHEFNDLIPSTATSVVFTDEVDSTFDVIDLSASGDGSVVGWLDGTTFYVATIDGTKVIAHPNCNDMFMSKTALQVVDFTNLDTSDVCNMRRMFYGCTKLASVNVGLLNTDNVRSTAYMFYNCSSLTMVDASAWTLPMNTMAEYMFYGCAALETIRGAEEWNMSQCVSIDYMFYGCNSFVVLDLSGWDVASLKTAQYTFSNMENIVRLDLSNWNLPSKMVNTSYMFSKCSKLCYIYSNNWSETTYSGLTSSSMFNTLGMGISGGVGYAHTGDGGAFVDRSNASARNVLMFGRAVNALVSSSATSVIFNSAQAIPDGVELMDMSHGYDGSVVGWLDGAVFYITTTDNGTLYFNEDCYRMFYGRSTITSIEFSGVDMNNVVDMSYMFYGCTKLSGVDLSELDLSNVADTSYMFYNCTAMKTVNITIPNVTTMRYMFYNCYGLTSLDLSGWGTSDVTDMSYVFYGCYGLMGLDLGSFDTENVTDMSYMLYNCYGLASLDMAGWNTAKVTNMQYMFYNCYGLTELNVNHFDVGRVTNMYYMFYQMKGLTELDLSSWAPTSVTNTQYMFGNCTKLTTICAQNWSSVWSCSSSSNMFSGCTQLVGAIAYNSSYKTWAYANYYTGYFTAPDGVATTNVLTTGEKFLATIPSAATSVKFGNYSANVPESGTTDVSATGDGSVVAWLDGTIYYVSTADGSEIELNENCYKMFYGKTALTEIVLENIDASRVINASYMFYNCTAVTELDLSEFNATNVTDMSYMFYAGSANTTLTAITFSPDLDTSNVKNMSYMFNNRRGITELDLSMFSVESLTNSSYMFYYCNALTTIYANDWLSVTTPSSSSYMFRYCNKLVGAVAYNSSYYGWTRAGTDYYFTAPTE